MEKGRSRSEAVSKEDDFQVGTNIFYVPSDSHPGESRMVTLVAPEIGKPIQYICSCRSEFGLLMPPAGWMSCWHMGAVTRSLGSKVRLDGRYGFILTEAED
jgi:hypothetical protein